MNYEAIKPWIFAEKGIFIENYSLFSD